MVTRGIRAVGQAVSHHLAGLSAYAGENPRRSAAVYGHTAIEAASRGSELLTAMKEVGLIGLNARFARYTRDQYKGGRGSTPKRFENGKVVTSNFSNFGAGQSAYLCNHGQRPGKDNGPDSWAAYFCADRSLPKDEQCAPLWRQKDGSFRVK
ncbi:hypothetical protein [Streptomyces syringium]|uniref:hypothetical protein n=1 Tax=Streptomyces syringium TaxID=76729 RepID=UPI0037D59A5E